MDDFIRECRDAGYILLPLTDEHISQANRLIWNGEGEEHKDPFDRILLAQAIYEGMHFLTHDDKIPAFKQSCVISV